MNVDAYARELALRTGFGRALQGLLALFIALTLLLAAALATRADKVRTVIVPPVVRQGFWVDEAAVSPEYLEQMALFVAQLVYNVTPANAEYNLRLLLQHASPELYGALRQQGEATARRLRADNATTLFAVRAVTHDPSGGRVALHGVLSTYINEKRVAESPRVYRFSFDYRGGRLYVRAIVETSDADPLGARLAREPGA